jgi:hypothetical protein
MKTARISYQDWKREIKERYPNQADIVFVCPLCGYHQTVKACEEAGMSEGMIGFSCIGRMNEKPRRAFGGKGKGPCDYAGGGLFQLNPVIVKIRENGNETEIGVFDVAERPFCDDPKYAVSKPSEKGKDNHDSKNK